MAQEAAFAYLISSHLRGYFGVKDSKSGRNYYYTNSRSVHLLYQHIQIAVVMLRQIKPKNARSKRMLEKKAPQVHENAKMTLFLRYTSCSDIVQLVMRDLQSLKRPLCVKFDKKNEIRPFEDPSSLEFFSEKNDAHLLVYGSHTKKRQHCLTLIRTFDYKILDMLELLIDQDSVRTLSQFKNAKAAVGLKPMISFSGTPFESPTPNAYTLAKSLFLDLLKGEDTNNVDVEGFQYMIHISAGEETATAPNPPIHLRCYLIKTKKSGTSLPRVEVEEMGPRVNFRVGRIKEADSDMMKEAMKKPKSLVVSRYRIIIGRDTDQILQPKEKKNIETDIIGDKVGRIHMGKQDIGSMQTRKMKGLKRDRDAEEDIDGEDDDGGVELKRSRA